MFEINSELKKLPEKPGVYIMKDENESVVYVGKAKVLKNRVKQYFANSTVHSARIKKMVSLIKTFEYIITANEIEALVLECNLIKKYKPPYNVMLRDDKTYPFIRIDIKSIYPSICVIRNIKRDGARYFGPYPNSKAARRAADSLAFLFGIRTCKLKFPRDKNKKRPCLNYYIGKCKGPCSKNIDQNEYMEGVESAQRFLSGKQETVILKMKEKMTKASQNLEFETAARLRDGIVALEKVKEEQNVFLEAKDDKDIIAVVSKEQFTCINLLFVREGKLLGQNHFIFDSFGDNDEGEILQAFIKQFYGKNNVIPSEILLSRPVEDIDTISLWLTQKKEKKVYIKIPKKGDKFKLIKKALENAQTALEIHIAKIKEDRRIIENGLLFLKECTELNRLPKRIEAYDISNLGMSDKVGSMIVFIEGKPDKKEYRRFRIKTVKGQNDYASMQEVLYRRFKSTAANFLEKPDLILVDGGKGHVSAAIEVMNDLNINIPVLGMAKDKNHKTSALVLSNIEYELKDNISILRFISGIQDEAHRFAFSYSKKLSEKRYKKSILDNIEGVGAEKRKALIKKFGSAINVKKASIDELAKTNGINNKLAEKIYKYFHN